MPIRPAPHLALAAAAFAASLAGTAEAATNPPTLVGIINPDGTSQLKTRAFRVQHTGVGNYTILFAQPYSRFAFCQYNIIGDAHISAVRFYPSKCEVAFANASGPSDELFDFSATGTDSSP